MKSNVTFLIKQWYIHNGQWLGIDVQLQTSCDISLKLTYFRYLYRLSFYW